MRTVQTPKQLGYRVSGMPYNRPRRVRYVPKPKTGWQSLPVFIRFVIWMFCLSWLLGGLFYLLWMLFLGAFFLSM